MATLHENLCNEILIYLSKTGRITAWANRTGTCRAMRGEGVIRYGLIGSSDIIGIREGGQMICVEIKIGTDKQREAQAKFQKMIERRGGIYILARSVEDVKCL